MLKNYIQFNILFIIICNVCISYSQTSNDTLRIPLLKKTTKKGWLIKVIKPKHDPETDSSIIDYPAEIVERKYYKIPTNYYQSNIDKIQIKDIVLLVGMDKSRTKKYIIADIDMDGRLSDEDVHVFDKTDIKNFDYWKTNAPVFSFPYSVMDNGQVVQKYSTYRIIPWNLIEIQDISKLLFDVVLYPVDHYESDLPYSNETLLVSDMGDKGDPDLTFSVLVSDKVCTYFAESWRYQGDIINYQLKNYKIISLEKGRRDYLVLATATADDMNESLKPYFPGNTPEDITFTLSNESSANRLHDYRGKFLLLNFWGTWCGPCRKITPDLVKLYQVIDKSRIAMLGVNCEFNPGNNAKANPQDYIEEVNIEWPNTFEILEKDNKGLFNATKVTNFPSLILIDDKGVVQARATKFEEVQKLIADIRTQFETK